MKDKKVLLNIKKGNYEKLLKYGRSAILKNLVRDFLNKLNKEDIKISCNIKKDGFIFVGYNTTLFDEDHKKLREVSRNNGVSITSLINFIIENYL